MTDNARRSAAAYCRAAFLAGGLCFLYTAVVLCLQCWPVPMLAFGCVAWRHTRRWKATGTSHGTARLADLHDLHSRGLLAGEGLILARAGHALPPTRWQAIRNLFTAPIAHSESACSLFLAAFGHARWQADSLIRLRRFHHLLTCAPPGAGKGTGVLLPNLLSYPGACVIFDPKGENYRITAEYRCRAFGHRIVRIDPFDIVRQYPGYQQAPAPDSFNPFVLVNPSSPDLLDWAMAMADALVVRDKSQEKDPHWNDSAELFLSTFIAFVLAHGRPRERNLQTVRDLLADPIAFQGALKLMRQLEDRYRMLRRRAGSMNYFVDKEFGSVMTTTGRHTAWLDSERVASAIEKTTFDPKLLLAGRMTIYLCLPEHQLHAQAGFLRLMLTSLLRCVTSGGPQEKNLVLFLLDEAGHIGHMRCLEEAITLLRGYGVRLWFFFQSLSQIEATFGPKAGVVLDAIDTQQFFGLNGLNSADLVSGRLGDATIVTSNYQEGQSGSRSSTHGQGHSESTSNSDSNSTTYSETGRRLLQPAEVLQLPRDQTVIFDRNSGAPPILGTLMRYYDAPEFTYGHQGVSARRTQTMSVIAGAFLLCGLLTAIAATFWTSSLCSSPQPGLLEVSPDNAPLQGQRAIPVITPLRVPQQPGLPHRPPQQPLPGQLGLP